MLLPAVVFAWWPFRGQPRREPASDTPQPTPATAPPPQSREPVGPRLEFDSVKRIQRYRDAEGGHRAFEDVQIWLANRPEEGEPAVPVPQLRAAITFRQDGVPVFEEARAQWVVSPVEDTRARVTMYDCIDLQPNGPPGRLLIAYKWPGEKPTFIYGFDNTEHPGARIPERALSPGDYDLIVTVANHQIEETFTFRFTNPGAPGPPTIAGPLRVTHSARSNP